jgi:hypothetical protein
VLLISACAPVPPAFPISPEDMIATNVAGTIAALPTNTPPPTATQVILPSPTEPPPTETATPTVMPSLTQLPTLTPTQTNTPTPKPKTEMDIQIKDGYACRILEKSPKNDTVFQPGSKFDGKWIIRNEGEKAWDENAIDVFYLKGDKFHDHEDIVDLPMTVKPGTDIEFILDMTAPSKVGTYTTTWAFGVKAKEFCVFSITIKVQKK